MASPRRPRLGWRLLRLFAGAAAVGTLLELMGAPAGMLLGAIIGSALANQRWTAWLEPVEPPECLRHVGLMVMGFVVGALLTVESLSSTAMIALPVALAYLLLGVVNLCFVTLLMSRYGVDPVTAVLAITPGGLAEVMSMTLDRGAQITVVLTVHAVRVFTLVLVVLPALLWVLS